MAAVAALVAVPTATALLAARDAAATASSSPATTVAVGNVLVIGPGVTAVTAVASISTVLASGIDSRALGDGVRPRIGASAGLIVVERTSTVAAVATHATAGVSGAVAAVATVAAIATAAGSAPRTEASACTRSVLGGVARMAVVARLARVLALLQAAGVRVSAAVSRTYAAAAVRSAVVGRATVLSGASGRPRGRRMGLLASEHPRKARGRRAGAVLKGKCPPN